MCMICMVCKQNMYVCGIHTKVDVSLRKNRTQYQNLHTHTHKSDAGCSHTHTLSLSLKSGAGCSRKHTRIHQVLKKPGFLQNDEHGAKVTHTHIHTHTEIRCWMRTQTHTHTHQVLKKPGFFQDGEHGAKVTDAVHLIQCFFARDPLTGERCVLINETDISRMKGVQVLYVCGCARTCVCMIRAYSLCVCVLINETDISRMKGVQVCDNPCVCVCVCVDACIHLCGVPCVCT